MSKPGLPRERVISDRRQFTSAILFLKPFDRFLNVMDMSRWKRRPWKTWIPCLENMGKKEIN